MNPSPKVMWRYTITGCLKAFDRPDVFKDFDKVDGDYKMLRTAPRHAGLRLKFTRTHPCLLKRRGLWLDEELYRRRPEDVIYHDHVILPTQLSLIEFRIIPEDCPVCKGTRKALEERDHIKQDLMDFPQHDAEMQAWSNLVKVSTYFLPPLGSQSKLIILSAKGSITTFQTRYDTPTVLTSGAAITKNTTCRTTPSGMRT